MMDFVRRQRMRLLRIGYVQNMALLRRNARLYLLSVVLNGLGNSVFMLFYNLYIVEGLGHSRDFLGLLQSIPSGIALLAGIPAGMLGDRLGRRPVMLVGGSMGLLSLWAFLVSPSQPLMVLWTVVQGVANTCYWLNIAPFLMQNSSEEERPLLFSADFGMMTLAAFVGSLVAGGLPAYMAGRMDVGPESAEAYRAAMLIGLTLNALALLPIWMIRELRWPGPRTSSRTGLGNVLHLKAPMVKFLLPNLLLGFGAALLIPYMNLFFKEQFPIDDRALGTIFAPRDLFTAVATMAGPALALRLGKIRSVVFTQLASLGFLLVVGFVPVLPIAALAFWLRGALMNMGHPLFSAFMMEQTPEEERGTVNSIYQMSWQVGWMVGPAISGAVQTRAGFAPLFLTTGVFYTLSTISIYVFFHDAEALPEAASPVET
jgi:MFS family permease